MRIPLVQRWAGEGELPPSPAPHPQKQNSVVYTKVWTHLIVQQAVVTILNQIYEVDFQGFSYGFRPGRSPHQALDALTVGIQRKRVNWVLDADIRGFFR